MIPWGKSAIAVGLVHGCPGQLVSEDLKIGPSIDASLARQRERLAEALDDRGDQEIAAELD
jgi:hypothetical protein